jgi:hypothetical protein
VHVIAACTEIAKEGAGKQKKEEIARTDIYKYI